MHQTQDVLSINSSPEPPSWTGYSISVPILAKMWIMELNPQVPKWPKVAASISIKVEKSFRTLHGKQQSVPIERRNHTLEFFTKEIYFECYYNQLIASTVI